jgi:hypothetical protein
VPTFHATLEPFSKVPKAQLLGFRTNERHADDSHYQRCGFYFIAKFYE